MTTPAFVSSQVKLAPLTSWQVGGPAEYLALPRTLDEVLLCQRWAQDQELPMHLLGGGSNVLIADEGLPGLTICLKNLTGVEITETSPQLKLTCLAGTSKSELLKIFLKHKLAPALFLAGLPGDVGGGVVMNAGVAEAFTPREFTEITEWVEVLRPDGSVKRFQHDELEWRYRHSQGWQPGVLVRVGIAWSNEPDEQILTRVKDANRTRLQKQPLDMPSCGSVFVNPPGHKAAQLIDASGLKGYTVGGAQVSLKHANFIVNIGDAKATDILAVIRHVKETVKQKTGVELKTEVIYMDGKRS